MDKLRLVPIRGLLCFLIVVHHIYRETPESFSHIFFIYNNVGFWVVSMFFFFSGYGLKLSLENKSGYLSHGFLKKKFFNILFPSLVIGIIYICVYGYDGQFSVKRLLILLKYGQSIPTSHWFIYVLFCQYTIFFLCYKSFKCLPLSIYTALTVGFVVLLYLLNYPSIWYKSTLFICGGMLYYSYLHECKNTADRRLSVIILSTFLMLFIVGGVAISDDTIYKVAGNIAISILTLFIFIGFSKHFIINNELLKLLGKYSMYIYLLHQPILDICQHLDINTFIGPELLTILIFIITCSLAVLCSNMMKGLQSKL